MYEWEYLSKLLHKGYPLVECLHILQKDSRKIERSLQQGEDIQSCILRYASDQLKGHLTFFLGITSLGNAIICSMHMTCFEKAMRKKLKKETAYPLFIFFFAYITLLFFLWMVIPQLMLSFSIETMDRFFIVSILLLKILCASITGLWFIIVLLYFTCRMRKVPKAYLQKLYALPVCREYVSYLFSSYLKELETEGLSTKKAISFLTALPDKPLFSIFAKDLQARMEKGEELPAIIKEHPYICDMFRMNFAIGVKTGTLKACLQDYISFQEECWSAKIRRISMLIQVISYGFVGFLVIMVYQILLVPLQLLETI